KSEISNVVVNNKPLDALTVWGKIATWLRTNGSLLHFQTVATHTSISLQDSTLIINTNDAKIKTFEDIKDNIKSAINALGLNLELKIVKIPTKLTKDGEIARIKEIVGDTPINIKR
ncbi:MAG: hypothetical protein FWF58_02045, partial [Firmicutes bacterium]|nr:hypothetical protein [Bacillota bacterium]